MSTTSPESDGPAVATGPLRPRYSPVEPPNAARRSAILRQALRLPKTLLAIRRIVAEDYRPDALDEHLWAFRGFR